VLDSVAACPPLSLLEQQAFDQLRAQAKRHLAPECAAKRAAWIASRVAKLAARTGMTEAEAKATLEKQIDGLLLASVEFEFDDLGMATVADVLADPMRFESETLADPLEGVADGRCKAKVMIGDDGLPFIHSFAHGRTVYRLRYDAAAVRARLTNAIADFVRLVGMAELDAVETVTLVHEAAERADVGVRAVNAVLKAAAAERHARQFAAARERAKAERSDPRPQVARPEVDAAWLPVLDTLDAAAGAAALLCVRGAISTARSCSSAGCPFRELTLSPAPTKRRMLMTSLPVPEQWTLCKLTDREVAEEIEKLIDFVDGSGRSVHLPMEFVRHYTTRHDGVLPTVVAIATLPIILADGGVLGEERGLDVERGISFIIPREVMALLPEGAVTDEAVAREMTFLTDKWLGDVATDYAGKCVIIAIALSIIERSLLDSRPTFFGTAGRRGSGKTTTLIMLIKAVTGIWPAAAAWSSNEEERRKALLSYFLSGASYILWDNIPRGTQINCPHIERSCTSAFYIDRRLGVSEAIRTAAGAIHLFTGNAIGAKGDMASRSLTVQLTADRPDPENRAFKHPDPVAWTDAHRVEILRALYTILRGNPTLKEPRNAAMRTRFKMWWRLVGSAVEHAAVKATGAQVNFQTLFLNQDAEDEDDNALVEALITLRTWAAARKNAPDLASALVAGIADPAVKRTEEENKSALAAKQIAKDGKFSAADLAPEINDTFNHPNPLRDAYRVFHPMIEPGDRVSAKAIGIRLKTRVGEPVRGDSETLILRREKAATQGKAPYIFWVETTPDPAPKS
jgi:hypothetical protein